MAERSTLASRRQTGEGWGATNGYADSQAREEERDLGDRKGWMPTHR
jgi:hypothetical protein